jgi:hypothetical protein
VANTLKDSNEIFKSAMAFLVEPAVVEKLIHRVLLSLLDEGFKQLKARFGHKQFLVARIADLGSVSLTRNFMHCHIVVTVNVLMFGCKVVSLHSEAISIKLEVSDMSCIIVVILVQMRKFVINSIELLQYNTAFAFKVVELSRPDL